MNTAAAAATAAPASEPEEEETNTAVVASSVVNVEDAPPPTIEMQSHVLFVCVSERRKLRVKVLTRGYLAEANCQFPRDVRAEGCYYRAPAAQVRLVCTGNKYFYAVQRAAVEVLGTAKPSAEMMTGCRPAPPATGLAAAAVPAAVYQDDDTDECCICMSETKSVVFNCGHLYTCKACSLMVRACPICRQRITMRIDKDRFG